MLAIAVLRQVRTVTGFCNALQPVMSSSSAAMLGLAAANSSRFARRRPEMITSLPSLWKASASPPPMPEPPVMKMVLPVSWMGRLLERSDPESQSGKRSPNIGSPLTDWALVASS